MLLDFCLTVTVGAETIKLKRFTADAESVEPLRLWHLLELA
jgi:hypothetical protein